MSHLEVETALLAIFMVRRKTITCPKCDTVGTLKGVEPSPTSKAAAQCSSCSQPTSMDEIHVRLPEQKVASRDATSSSTPDSRDELQTLRDEISTLRESLQRMTSMYEVMAAQNIRNMTEGMKEKNFSLAPSAPQKTAAQRADQQQQQRKPASTMLHQFTFQATKAAASTTTAKTPSPPTWAEKAKANLPTRKKPSTTKSIAASVRLFQEETGPSGYEYIYLPRNRRMKRSEARSSLRRLGLEPSRLLDITMPTRQVIGLLVHVQYAPTVREVLAKHEIKPTEFVPTDPKHIADPKHATLSGSDRQLLANSIHANRMMRTLRYMRPEVATAVGRYFVDQKWLTLTEFTTVVPHKDHQPNPAAAAFLTISHRPQPKKATTAPDSRKRRALSISSSDSHHSDAMTTTQ
ncbi:hypothetical protein INT44_004811 [Umbelopsis vinacea]|uniref:Uncharacterized protein n=1 Tax=Umbelopsis vinacea TaxID=44442 RepID=A0A8H7Q9A6_9FUNG|nr:hypothetical protein INT44_004811 [Umbelopsis vinacea]